MIIEYIVVCEAEGCAVTMREAIQRAVAAFRDNPSLDALDVADLLCQAGIERRRAAALVVFVPTAFARVMMQGSGVKFSEFYFRKGASGKFSRPYSLREHPVFQAAMQFAATEVSSNNLTAIARRSSEFSAISEATVAGELPADLVLSPMVVIWDIEMPAPARSVRPRAWWQFWK